jgi:glycosyltransferase involved in cell wall biosynthesis
MKFSLVIPCFNEAKNLPLLLKRCKEVANKPGVEIILVDNGSTDDTKKILKNLLPLYPGCRGVYVKENLGYGYGILFGLKKANGNILGWTHADLQTNPKDFLYGLNLFKKHGENIFVKGLRCRRPFSDAFFTLGMSVFETFLLGRFLRDINAQPTMFSRDFFNSFIDPPSDFSLDLFVYYLAKNKGLNVHRFPVRFGKRIYGTSHWNVNLASKWKFILRTVFFSLKLKNKI